VGAFRLREEAERFDRGLPRRRERFGLPVAPEKTRLLRFSRFQPSRERRLVFLGFEFFWLNERPGMARGERCTAL
jgi:hypothetical protein